MTETGIAIGWVRVIVGVDCVRIYRTDDNTNIRLSWTDAPDLIKVLVATLGPDFIYEHGQVNVMNGPTELIAAYVAGDGTDPQRVALADGIRSELFAHGADWCA